MTRGEALEGLKATSPHARAQAVRALYGVATVRDRPALRRHLKSEEVAYIRKLLEDVLSQIGLDATPPAADDADEVPSEVRKQIYSQAVEWAAGSILHEVASPIGLVSLSAKRELGERWDGSATKRHLETIRRLFDAIEMLKTAAASPKVQELDLAALISDFIAAELSYASQWISLVGPKPFLIRTDPGLVLMAFANGLRNAVEAVLEVGPQPPGHAITVSWESTDKDHWVSILDTGMGFSGVTKPAFEIGSSTKRGHSGFGLTIALRAIETLNGEIELAPGFDGGASYVMRWPK